MKATIHRADGSRVDLEGSPEDIGRVLSPGLGYASIAAPVTASRLPTVYCTNCSSWHTFGPCQALRVTTVGHGG